MVRAEATLVKPRFFFALASSLLVFVLLGFGPTFYLAPLFETSWDARGIPVDLIVHATFLTAWFVGLVGQSGLILTGRRAVHERLGRYGVVCAAGVFITGAAATVLVVERAAAFGAPPRALVETLVTSNTVNLLVFASLVSIAIYKRAKPQVHKRLMLIASIAIIGPAVSPARPFGVFLRSLLPDFFTVPLPLVFWVLLVIPMFVHDVRTVGRVHPATLWGTAAKATAVLITLGLVASGASTAYANWLEGL